jgi:hypothetical protein
MRLSSMWYSGMWHSAGIPIKQYLTNTMHYLAAQTPHKHRTLSNKHHTISHKHHTLRHKHPHYLKNTANDLTNIRLNHEEK